MFPKFKKKILSFLMDEKGSMSKDKILKGALIISSIGLAAKSSKAFEYEDYQPDDYLGYDGHGTPPIPCNPIETLCKIGGAVEDEVDGGRVVVPNVVQPGQALCGGVICEVLEENEIRRTWCKNLVEKKCLSDPACFWPVSSTYPLHSSNAETVHKSVDRSWHTNRINIFPTPGARAIEATHSHHGRHHNANTVSCKQSQGTPYTVTHTSNCIDSPP